MVCVATCHGVVLVPGVVERGYEPGHVGDEHGVESDSGHHADHDDPCLCRRRRWTLTVTDGQHVRQGTEDAAGVLATCCHVLHLKRRQSLRAYMYE